MSDILIRENTKELKIPENFLDIFREFMQWIDVSKNTRYIYSRYIRIFFKWMQENDLTIYDVTRSTIIRYKNYMMEHNHKPNYINVMLMAIKRFFRFLFEANYLSKDVTINIKRVMNESGFLRDCFTEDEIRMMLNSLEEDDFTQLRTKVIIQLLVTTGMRLSELQNISIYDLDNRHGKYYLYIKQKGKTHKDFKLLLGENTYNLVQKYWEKLKFRYTSGALTITEKIDQQVFTDGRLFPICNSNISGIVRNFLKSIGMYVLGRTTVHSFRHTAATICLKNGFPIENVRDMLGHKNIGTTLGYAHHVNAENRNTEKFLDRILCKSNGF